MIKETAHPHNEPTNRVESKIRPFVLGRKNRLSSGSPSGAQGAANLYGLIETANGLEPYRYLRALIERLLSVEIEMDHRALLRQFMKSLPR